MKERIVITVENTTGGDVHDLAGVLKRLLRGHKWRCVDLAPEKESRARVAAQFITLAAESGQIHRWTFKGNTVYWATVEQPVTATTEYTHTRAHPPHPPVGRKTSSGAGVGECVQTGAKP